MFEKFFQNFCLFCLIIFLIFPTINFAQSDVLRLYERDDFVELEKKLNSGSDKDNVFLRSIFKVEAKEAIEMMKDMIKKDPKNESLPAVMERVGLYQFSQGLYNAAREPFKYLAQKYSDSGYGETGMYYTARCLQAIGNSDSSQIVLEEFLRKYPSSKYSNLILQELRTGLKLTDNEKEIKKEKPETAGKPEIFTVQTGAFSTQTNARIQKQFLEEKGFQPSIYTKFVNRKKYFVVCLKKFQEKNEAESYGKEIAKKYKIDYRVIDVNELQSAN
jgi:hypothetical protein